MASCHVVPLPICGVSAKRRPMLDAHKATDIRRMIAHFMRNSVACRLLPESHCKHPRDDASTLKLLRLEPESPAATIRCNHVAGSDRKGFSLRTMMMIIGVSVVLAASGTAATICTPQDCRHIFSAHAGLREDRGGLANPSPSKTASKASGTTMKARAINKPGTKSSTSPMSPRNQNPVEASLLAMGIQPGIVQASAEANNSADDNNTWQVVHNGFLKVRSGSCLKCKVIGMKDRCIMASGHREGDWIRLLHEPGYMLAVANGSPLLQKSEVSYTKIHKGTCAEHGLYPITDDISCGAAALAIGFQGLAVQVMHKRPTPEGCYMLGLTLWMSVNPQNKGHGVMGHRQPLCASRPTPVVDPCQKIRKLNTSSPWPVAPTQNQELSSHSGRHTLF